MNDKTDDTGDIRRKDTTEYSGSKAPETRREAEEKTAPSDARLIPGGPRGANIDVGMSSLEHGQHGFSTATENTENTATDKTENGREKRGNTDPSDR